MKHFLPIMLTCLLSILTFTPDVLLGQNFSYGFTAGLNAAALRGPFNEDDSGGPRIAANLGLFVNYQLTKKLSLQTELLYSGLGANYKRYVVADTMYTLEIAGFVQDTFPATYAADVKGGYKLDYFSIPMHIVWRFAKKGGMSIGIRTSYLLVGENKGDALVDIGREAGNRDQYATEEEYEASLFLYQEDEEFDESKSLNKFDFALVGTGYWHINRKLTFSMSANYGLTSVQQVNNLIPDKYYNIHLSTMISYVIN